MAITAKPYGNFLLTLGTATHDLINNSHKFALLTSDYTPDLTADVSYDDIAGDEVADSGGADGGYATGGAALVNKTYTVTGVVGTLNADPIGWAALTATLRYAVLYKVDTGNPLIGLVDLGTDRTYNGEPFQLTFTNGVLSITGS